MKEFMNYNFNIEKIILACFVAKGSGMTTHTDRPSHGLALHTSGKKIYRFSDGRILTVNKNDIIYLPKYSTYNVFGEIPGECYAINFDISEQKTFSPFIMQIKNSGRFTDYFKTAQRAWDKRKIGYEMQCKACLYNVIYDLQQEYFLDYMPKNKLYIIKPALDYIHTCYTAENISIEKAAMICGITPEYFRRIFKSFYGVSPVSYVNNLKLTRAKELIESGMYSVAEAAAESGYNDMSYFSREFKKHFNVCPSKVK